MCRLIATLLMFVVYSCGSGLNVQEFYRSDHTDFNHIRKSKITICGVHNIALNEFEYSTNYEYSDTSVLNNIIVLTVCNQFKTLIPSATPVEMVRTVPSFFNGVFSFKDNKAEEVSAFFNNLGTEYLMFFDKINAKKIQHNYTFTTHSGSTVPSLVEMCELNIEVELWDVKEKERLMKFNAAAEETVTDHSYLTALNSAIDKSINAAVLYIKNGGEL